MSLSGLSVVIPTHNDSPECVATVRSIRATAGSAPECIVVDDCTFNGSPVFTPDCGQVTLIRTERRIGVGPARHLGAMRASGDYLLFTDSHMRFTPGWYEAAMSKIVGRGATVHCGSCHDFGTPEKPYYGARFNFFGHDPNVPSKKQVFECNWASKVDGDDYPIQASMGAIYFVPKSWFFILNPLRFLHSWGGDEQALSLKSWMAGGEVRMLTSVKAAHRFQHSKSLKFRRKIQDDLYNKLFLIHTILPHNRAVALIQKFKRDGVLTAAQKQIEADWHLIEVEREYNRKLFTVSFDSFLTRFGIPFPE